MQRQPLEQQAFVGIELERVACLAAGVERPDAGSSVDLDRGAVEVPERGVGASERIAVQRLERGEPLAERLAAGEALPGGLAFLHAPAEAANVAGLVAG